MSELAIIGVIQAAQTAALLTVAITVIYAFNRAGRELKQAGTVLNGVTNMLNELNQNVRRVWERIDAIEAQFKGFASRLDRLESEQRRPPGPSP
jgi:biopolymer transport protein ExbB/TolQ